MNLRLFLVTALAATCALTAKAQIFYFEDFSAFPAPVPADQEGVFTQGTTAMNKLWLWGTEMSVATDGGNPEAWLATGSFNAAAWVAVAAPATSQTLTFSVDYRIDENPWNQHFDVIGVSGGDVVSELGGVNEKPTGGDLLFGGPLIGTTNGDWATVSHDILIPSGYSAVIFRVATNHNPDAIRGFDNISISAIPEPSTYAAAFGTLFLALALWRRRTTQR